MRIASKLMMVLMIVAVLFGSFAFASGVEASARTATWVVSVTYQNVGTAATSVNVSFYKEGEATAVTYDPLSGGTLQPGAGASFFIGNVSNVAAGFRGSAVLSASQPLVATVVQFHANTGTEAFRMRMLSNAFQAGDGSTQYLIATTLGNTFDRTTVFSIQNIESQIVTATVTFYNAADGSVAATKVYDIQPSSSKYIEMDNTALTGLPSGTFNGSAIVTAVMKASPSTPAKVVAAASELYTNSDVGANFEGVPLSRAANKIYMATGLCRRFGLDTFYAVQNADLSNPATITVQYYNTDGTAKATDGPYNIGPGQKKSITTCAPNSGTNMADFTGSAVITSTGGKIVAIGKAQLSQLSGSAGTRDVFTIFMGEAAGTSKMALPFVRWANDANFNASSNLGGKQRTFIAIQNLEATPAVFNVKYYGKNGDLLATHPLTIAGNAKGNSDAAAAGAIGKPGQVAGEFGYYADGSFGGAVIIEAAAANPTAKFIAIARVQHPGAGEDYNAVPVQ